ncbi:MAG: TRC40/GET3/ArsA family transport-energizing ATPase, partial [Deltaproteobacteria bacterium]|nr:TRC40/GET3/ArsA family transport-energizing ATPase [Deltaproteobacteria bacterium]
MSELPSFLTNPDLRLLLFGGKGGVGKTTCAVATAVALARREPGRPLLLVSTDPAHSLKDSLGDGSALPGLSVVEFRAEDALAAFLDEHREHFREIARRGTFLADEDVDRFTELSLPGIDEFLAVLQLSRWLAESTYERIIVDTAPTGHTLRLLETPRLMTQWLGAMEALVAKHRYMRSLFTGRYRLDEVDAFLEEWSETATRMRGLFRDRRACLFVPVTTAERLSIEETTRLLAELGTQSLPVSDIVVNRLHLDSAESCETCEAERRRKLRELRRLPAEFERCSLWAVPERASEVRGAELLAEFWSGARRLSPADLAGETLPPARPPRPARVEGAAPLPSEGMVLLALAGKGGVGKTTLSAAVALRFAREFEDRSLLLCSSDPAHSLSDCLDAPIGPTPVLVRRNLSAVEIDAAGALGALKEEYAE